jgi:hypothetical protein
MNTKERNLDTTTNEGRPGTGAVVGGVAGGVAGGAIAGGLAGGVTGPVGAVIGAAAGAIAGALAGKGMADPAAEDAYWRDNYRSRPYVESDANYEDYSPAYRQGLEAHTRYPDRHFDEIESDLGRDWPTSRGSSSLEWDRAKHASRDAWTRVKDNVERAIPGDSDHDGR